MVGSIVNSLLHCLESSLELQGVINGPVAAEILTVNGELEQLRIKLADVVKDIVEFVVELGD